MSGIQSLHSSTKFTAVLRTAMVLIVDSLGVEREVRALLDSGSQASFISESCVQLLGLKRSNGRVIISGIGNASAGSSRGTVTISLKPRSKLHQINVDALVIPKVAARLPDMISREDLKWLSTVELADPKFYKSRTIDILLGADVFFAILENGQLKSPTSNLVAQNTIYGWVIGGSSLTKSAGVQSHCTILNIDQTLRRFWEIENANSEQNN